MPFSRDLPDPGVEPGSPALQADSLPSEPPGKPLSIQTDKLQTWKYSQQAIEKITTTNEK